MLIFFNSRQGFSWFPHLIVTLGALSCDPESLSYLIAAHVWEDSSLSMLTADEHWDGDDGGVCRNGGHSNWERSFEEVGVSVATVINHTEPAHTLSHTPELQCSAAQCWSGMERLYPFYEVISDIKLVDGMCNETIRTMWGYVCVCVCVCAHKGAHVCMCESACTFVCACVVILSNWKVINGLFVHPFREE